MKKLFLTVIIAGTSLIAANDSNDSKYTFDKNAFNLALTGAAGVTTGVTFIGSLLVGGFFEMAEMTIGGGPLSYLL